MSLQQEIWAMLASDPKISMNSAKLSALALMSGG